MSEKDLIIVIEDEEDILDLIEFHLQKNDYDTIGFTSTKNVNRCLEEEKVSLMVVDRNLPGVEGSDFVKAVRDGGNMVPVIFLTARDRKEDIEEGFTKGGDDYMTKPFEMKELVLRIKAILRRTKKINNGKLKYKEIVLDIDNNNVYVSGNLVDLTKLEFLLLKTFIENQGKVLSRDVLIENVWGDEYEDGLQEKTVNVAVNRLKTKINHFKDEEYIKSVWGVGYRFQ